MNLKNPIIYKILKIYYNCGTLKFLDYNINKEDKNGNISRKTRAYAVGNWRGNE